jgi:hypothetical protein
MLNWPLYLCTKPHNRGQCPVLQIRSFFDEWLLSSDKAPRRVIARYGEKRQRSMTAMDAVKKEQYL